MAEPTEKKKKRARRNFAKELERITQYLEIVIRVKGQSADTDAVAAGEIKAYRDCLEFIQGGAK